MDIRDFVENFNEERKRKINIIENGSDEEKLNFVEDLIKYYSYCESMSDAIKTSSYRININIPEDFNDFIKKIKRMIKFYLKNKKKLNEINSFSIYYYNLNDEDDCDPEEYIITILINFDKISKTKSAAHKV